MYIIEKLKVLIGKKLRENSEKYLMLHVCCSDS